jgi:lipopolysaccharide exporter
MFAGSAWMIALRWATRLIGLCSTVILARLLVPQDFGIIAMAMLIVGMLELLNQTGQRLAIIRNPNPTRGHYDTAWTLSMLIGLGVGVAIFISAPLASIYFHEPRTIPVIQCLALRAALGGLENIGIVDFRRDLRFDLFFYYNLCPKIFSACLTVLCAFAWRNYWALVVGILTSQVVMVVTSFAMHPYRPRLSLAKLGEIYSFSAWTLFRTIGFYFNGQVDQFTIGGVFGAAVMGRYAVAADVAASPLEEINAPMVAVLYPVMSKIQHDPERVRDIYLATLGWSAVICASVGVGVTLVAHDMVLFVLGSKWLMAEPLVGWLALSAGLSGLSSGAYTAFDVRGKPHLGAQMQWIRLLLLVMAIVPVALLLRSPADIALTRFLITAIFLPTLLFAVGREIGAGPGDYFRIFWRPAAAASVMGLFVATLNGAVPPSGYRLILDVVTGALTFTGTSVALWWVSGKPKAPESALVQSFRFLTQPRRTYSAGAK